MRAIFLIALCSVLSFKLVAQQSLKIIPFVHRNVKISKRQKDYFAKNGIARDTIITNFQNTLKKSLATNFATTIIDLTAPQHDLITQIKRKKAIVPLLTIDKRPLARKKFAKAVQDKFPRQKINYFSLNKQVETALAIDTANETYVLLNYYYIKNKGGFNLAFRNHSALEVSYTLYKPRMEPHSYKVQFPINFQKDMYPGVFTQYNKIIANKTAEHISEYKMKDTTFVRQPLFSLGLKINAGTSYMAQHYLNPAYPVEETLKLIQPSYSGGVFFNYSLKPNSWIGMDVDYLSFKGGENTKFILADSTGAKSGASNDKIKRTITYLALPVYFMQQFGKLKVGVGAQLNYGLNSSTTLTINKAYVGYSAIRSVYTNANSVFYKKYDIGGQVFLSWDMSKKIFVDVKYYYGLFNNSTNDFVKLKSQYLQVGVGFKIR